MTCSKYTEERNKVFDVFPKHLKVLFCYEEIIFSTNMEVLKAVVELIRAYECK
ncbi:hypothetical protein O3M35_001589 [Rhynocoris fuscipes]|uniref:Uncharacterized protein n=1 Tax=Rhynocoris fuscipes TaxID=488301 RepID=A0AAW1CRE4_9HEMI